MRCGALLLMASIHGHLQLNSIGKKQNGGAPDNGTNNVNDDLIRLFLFQIGGGKEVGGRIVVGGGGVKVNVGSDDRVIVDHPSSDIQ